MTFDDLRYFWTKLWVNATHSEDRLPLLLDDGSVP